MSITAGSINVLTLRLLRVKGERAAEGYIVRFELEAARIHPSHEDPPALAALANNRKNWRWESPFAWVSLAATKTIIGRADLDKPLRVAAANGTVPIPFTLVLHASQSTMDAVEHERNGGDLALTLNVQGDVFDGGDWRAAGENLTETIDRSKWITMLEEAGYGTSLVLELPFHIDFKTKASAIEDALRNSRRHLLAGNFREAIGECRVALDPIVPDPNDVGTARAMRADPNQRENLTKDQRELLLVEALKDYTQLAHHPTGDLRYQQYSRQDALMILGGTLGVLASYAERTPAGRSLFGKRR